jgi:hypothetical protein
MTAIQLALSFEIPKPKDLAISDKAAAFLDWQGDYAAINLKRKVEMSGVIFEDESRLYAPGSVHFAATVPQRKKPYTYNGNSEWSGFSAESTYHLAFAYCEAMAVQYSLMDKTKTHMADPHVNRTVFPHHVEFSYDEETGTISYDLGLAFYDLNYGYKKVDIRPGRPPARFWLHVEYPISEDSGAHYLDFDKSWFGYQYDTCFSYPVFGSYHALDNWIGQERKKKNTYISRQVGAGDGLIGATAAFIMPPLILRKMRGGSSKFWTTVVENSVNLFTTRTKLLFETYPGSSNFLVNRMSDGFAAVDRGSAFATAKAVATQSRGGLYNGSDVDLMGKFLTARSLKDLIDLFVPYERPPIASAPFYKHVLNTLATMLSNAEEIERWDGQHWRAAFEAVRDAYIIMAELVLATDVNALNAFGVDEVLLRTQARLDTSARRRTSYIYTNNIRDSINLMMKNKWFAEFEKTKQWRLFKSLITTEDDQPIRVLNETRSMLEQIYAKDPDALNEISRRHIKDIGTLHHEVIKVFNAVKHKPVQYKDELVEWLTSYGLDIPETNLKFVVPEDTNVVRNWGTLQGHCIGTYADNMARGTTILLGVWDAEAEGWIGHVQMEPIKEAGEIVTSAGAKNGFDDLYALVGHTRFISVRQFYGRHNSAVAPEYHDLVKRHLSQAVFAWWLKQAEQTKEEAQANGKAAV